MLFPISEFWHIQHVHVLTVMLVAFSICRDLCHPLVASGHLLVASGHLLVASGHLLVASGHLLVASGHLLVASGHLLVASGHLLVASGHLLLASVQDVSVLGSSVSFVLQNTINIDIATKTVHLEDRTVC